MRASGVIRVVVVELARDNDLVSLDRVTRERHPVIALVGDRVVGHGFQALASRDGCGSQTDVVRRANRAPRPLDAPAPVYVVGLSVAGHGGTLW